MAQGLNAVLAALLGAGAAAGGWLLARRPRRVGLAAGVGPHFLPDPALDWLRRAHRARGVWVAEHDSDGPRAERIVDAEALSVTQIASVDRRLEQARDREQSGVERLECGTLVYHAEAGAAAGLLLPERSDPAALETAGADLRRLLDGIRRRPDMVALTQAQGHEGALESAGSVGLRLAYQIERALEAEVVVAAVESAGVRVIGVSGRADRRLLDTLLPADSDLARMASGGTASGGAASGGGEARLVPGDPLGGVVGDRRERPGAVMLLPMRFGNDPVGAAALWLPTGREPTGPARGELMEALANAAPRIARAVEADRRKAVGSLDPLTGLLNRRGLDEALGRHQLKQGALVYADLDRFKVLNDALGHPAGDAALAHFARLIREQVRAGDAAARIGGEEFAIWLPGAGLELGGRIAERIRVKLGTTAWEWRGRSWPLSASFGVAACPETSRSLENLPAQADAALYVAKHSGRNRVERAARPTAGVPG